jgi:hypothetical protein
MTLHKFRIALAAIILAPAAPCRPSIARRLPTSVPSAARSTSLDVAQLPVPITSSHVQPAQRRPG